MVAMKMKAARSVGMEIGVGIRGVVGLVRL